VSKERNDDRLKHDNISPHFTAMAQNGVCLQFCPRIDNHAFSSSTFLVDATSSRQYFRPSLFLLQPRCPMTCGQKNGSRETTSTSQTLFPCVYSHHFDVIPCICIYRQTSITRDRGAFILSTVCNSCRFASLHFLRVRLWGFARSIRMQARQHARGRLARIDQAA